MPNFQHCRKRSLEIHTSELHNRVSKQIRISECYDFVLGYIHNDHGTHVVPRPQVDMPGPFTHSNQVSVSSIHSSPTSLFHDLSGLLAPCSPFSIVQIPHSTAHAGPNCVVGIVIALLMVAVLQFSFCLGSLSKEPSWSSRWPGDSQMESHRKC